MISSPLHAGRQQRATIIEANSYTDYGYPEQALHGGMTGCRLNIGGLDENRYRLQPVMRRGRSVRQNAGLFTYFDLYASQRPTPARSLATPASEVTEGNAAYLDAKPHRIFAPTSCRAVAREATNGASPTAPTMGPPLIELDRQALPCRRLTGNGHSYRHRNRPDVDALPHSES